MAHKGDTQAVSDSMPKVFHTIRRNGVFYFNARYPDSLIKAGLVKTKLNRRSLNTKNWREAQRLAAREYNFHLSQIEKMEAELESKDDPESRVIASATKFENLSPAKRRALVLTWFVEMEKRAIKDRANYREETDYEERELILQTAQEEMMVLEEHSSYGPYDWEGSVEDLLEKNGIEFEPKDIPADFVEFYRKAVIEVHWRTLDHYGGDEHTRRERVFKDLGAFSEMEETVGDSHTVGELCSEYFETKKKAGRSLASLKSYNVRFDILKECLGEGTRLSELDERNGIQGYEEGKKLLAFLTSLPAYARQKYPNHSLTKAAQMEAEKEFPELIQAKTQRDIFTDIKGILNFAVKRRWLSQNPFDGLEDSLPTAINRKPELFSGGELESLLKSSEFLTQRFKKTEGMVSEGRFWAVLLCLFHGMRLNEAASLLISDIRQESDIYFMDLTEFDESGNRVKQLKTKASERRLPIHKEAIKIGFFKYVKRRKKETDDSGDWLFPDLKPNNLGNKGAYISRWFSRIRDKHLGKQIKKGDKSIHTFRHSMANAVRAETDSDEILFAIGGWESSQRENSSRDYGKANIESLKSVIDKTRFNDFDPSFLYPKNIKKNLNLSANQ